MVAIRRESLRLLFSYLLFTSFHYLFIILLLGTLDEENELLDTTKFFSPMDDG